MLRLKLNNLRKRGCRQTIFVQIIVNYFENNFATVGFHLRHLQMVGEIFMGQQIMIIMGGKTFMALNAYVNSRHKICRIYEKAGFPSSHRAAMIWLGFGGFFSRD